MSKNQNGLTLVELLVVITIGSLIAIISTSILIQALENNRRIQQDITLRDEADYLMSQLFREFYTLKQSTVSGEPTNDNKYIKIPINSDELSNEQKSLPQTTCGNGVCDVITGFIAEEVDGNLVTKLYIKSNEIKLFNDDLILDPNSKIIKSGGTSPSYIMKLGIKNTTDSTSVWFENEVNTINDTTTQD